MRHNQIKYRNGVTLIELATTIAVSSILMLVVGVLIVNAANGWQQTYDNAHQKIKDDAQAVTLAFANIGRMANSKDYVIYNVTGSTFTPAVSPTPGQETVVSGNAVEFRYWDVSLDTGDTYNLMDVTKTSTAYALFYISGGKLKVDYGSCPPGAVPAGGGSKNVSNIKTIIIAENVTAGPGCGAFSHTSVSGAGNGSVRINIVLTDPDNGQQIRVMNSVLIRNKWPQ
ncbi:MAG: hypothetical protein A2Y10_13280 [Planctomycetes bacterium GWF2_41_51]|nr:MAG: hypothetical protein A2Y10_13280 [Planctomycetes bacterium GWF2_41_51]HBG27332.1 hypothetical protein [Phycisphaerales bacterium]